METRRRLQPERLRGSTKHTVKFQHKGKENILKLFFFFFLVGQSGQGLAGNRSLMKPPHF